MIMLKNFILVTYLALVIITFIFMKIEEYKGIGFAITPKEIYDCNEFNMFGAWCMFIFGLIFNPLFYLSHFIYWVFRVGRKD